MEALADEVQDGSVRRFCREVVLPCHQSMDYPDNPDDPFMGSTLFEDSTRVRQQLDDDSGLKALHVGPSPVLDSEHTIESDPLRTPTVGQEVVSDIQPTRSRESMEATTQDTLEDPEGPAATKIQRAPPTVDFHQALVLPDPPTDIGDEQLFTDSTPATKRDHETEEEEGSGRTGLVVGIVVAVLVTAIGGGGLLAWKYLGPKPKVETFTVEIPQERLYNDGGVVHADYGGKGGNLVFGLQESGEARVTISGNRNDFNYRWNGVGDLTILDLEPGPYRVSIRAGDVREDLKSRVIRRRTCTYEYNLSSGKHRWTEDGCN